MSAAGGAGSNHGVIVSGTSGVLVEAIRVGVAGRADGRGPAAILVDPERRHWDDALTDGGPIVLVTADPLTPEQAADAVVRGADAIVRAGDHGLADVLDALEVVLGGGCVLTPVEVKALARAARRVAVGLPPRLTPREDDILRLIARGLSVKQTANELDISPRTVENLQSRMFHKLGVRNRAQAIHRAHELGLLPPE